MGARLYNNITGHFTSVDPVPGGNTTAYTYPQDPSNQLDLDGKRRGPMLSDAGQAALDKYNANGRKLERLSKNEKQLVRSANRKVTTQEKHSGKRNAQKRENTAKNSGKKSTSKKSTSKGKVTGKGGGGSSLKQGGGGGGLGLNGGSRRNQTR